VLTDPRGPSLPQTALLNSQAFPAPLVYINGQGRFAGALHPGAHPGRGGKNPRGTLISSHLHEAFIPIDSPPSPPAERTPP